MTNQMQDGPRIRRPWQRKAAIEEIGAVVLGRLVRSGRTATVRSILFAPTTEVATPAGGIELVATVILDVAGQRRPEPLEAVVTFDGRRPHALRSVGIHALERTDG